jgi:hypothetical protein
MDRKTRFDRRVTGSKEGEVTFEKGHLVQTYGNDLAHSISTERKLTPMWSEPRRVAERILNSYKLETLDGEPLDGEYHARRIREFIPREGTELEAQQREFITNPPVAEEAREEARTEEVRAGEVQEHIEDADEDDSERATRTSL